MSEPKNRECFCCYCGLAVGYLYSEGSLVAQREAWAALREHDAACPKNPVRAEVERLREQIADGDAAYRKALESPCPDEEHCTCVPHLRAAAERLRPVVEKTLALNGARKAAMESGDDAGLAGLIEDLDREAREALGRKEGPMTPTVSPERIVKGLWWERAWRLVQGCTKASEGCANCWAEREAAMRSRQQNPKTRYQYAGVTDDGGRWTRTVRCLERNLDLPRRAKAPAVWAIWNDLFHEDVPDEFLDQAFATMGCCESPDLRSHVFIVLTKRPARMLAYAHTRYDHSIGWPPNVIPGTTAENQPRLAERWPLLRDLQRMARTAVFISYEPALGPLVLPPDFLALGPRAWLAAQGESGVNARPAHPDWFRWVRDQCAAAGVPFFFKGWGEWVTYAHGSATDAEMLGLKNGYIDADPHGDGLICRYRVGKKKAGRRLDGRTHDEFPEVTP